MAELLQFVNEDAASILAETKAKYESIANRTLNEGDPEMLLINTIAYLRTLDKQDINYTGRQNLVKYATGVALEELGFPFDVYRLDAQAAVVTVRYQLSEGHPSFLIPKDNRVKSQDGAVMFKTLVDINVLVGETFKDISVQCLTEGIIGNSYTAGTINIHADPLPYVSSVSNIDESAGGSDEETDDELRERIILAKSTFSTAGPEDAYKYFAKTAHPDIVDVEILSPTPAEIVIYPLLKGGIAPNSAILEAVELICDSKTVRPMNDVVSAEAPTVIEYEINGSIIVNKDAIAANTLNAVVDMVTSWKEDRKNRLGKDVMRNIIIGLMKQDGVYNTVLDTPSVDIIVAKNQVAVCTAVNITISGIADE